MPIWEPSPAELQLSGGGNSIEVGTLRFGASFNLNGARAVSIGQGVATIDTNGFSTTISQGIQNGTGGLVKAGIGTLVLADKAPMQAEQPSTRAHCSLQPEPAWLVRAA